MVNLSPDRQKVFLLALAIVCAAGCVDAQEYSAPPDATPVILDQKQAARLVLVQPQPDYPPVAMVNYLQGRVQLEVTVNSQGIVTHAHILEGNAVLAASALDAARHWTYRPFATPSGPVAFITTVKLNYFLNSAVLGLTPRQAEQDFMRQVKPPRVVAPQEDAQSGDIVHLHVLLNDQGQVDDLEPSVTGNSQVAAAREVLQSWTFRPAHWGNIPIAAYLDVNVPLRPQSIARVTANSEGR